MKGTPTLREELFGEAFTNITTNISYNYTNGTSYFLSRLSSFTPIEPDLLGGIPANHDPLVDPPYIPLRIVLITSDADITFLKKQYPEYLSTFA